MCEVRVCLLELFFFSLKNKTVISTDTRPPLLFSLAHNALWKYS